MKNDGSVKFWVNWYSNDWKKHCELMKHDYVEEMKKHLAREIENSNSRTDKNTTDWFRKNQIKEQLNQIEALKIVLSEV